MRLDLGAWIAGIGAVVVVAAVIGGYFMIPDPGEARALRLDAARLMTMQRIATGAQCAYTFTDRVPGSIAEIRRDFLERRVAVAVGNCSAVLFTPAEEETVSYEAADEEHIILCAEFRRPTPPPSAAETQPRYNGAAEFPELLEPRSVAGRHCYRIRLVKQVLPSPDRSAAQPM
jgi:hypothetical protein